MSTSLARRAARFASSSTSSSGAAGRHKVVVVGGGAGGLAAANQVWNAYKAQGQQLRHGDIAIIDPAQFHDYQPGWTVVGSGLATKESFRRPLDSLIPEYIAHIPVKVGGFEPDRNAVLLEDGTKVAYEELIVAPGLQINFNKIAGLESALLDTQKSGISSIYSYATADKTWDLIRSFPGSTAASQGRRAIFTQPLGIVKCAGAPQKIAYMADSYWSQSQPQVSASASSGAASSSGSASASSAKPTSEFITGMPSMFSVPHYSRALDAIRQSKGIAAEFNTNLVSVDPATKSATFEVVAGEKKGHKVQKEYGMMHVVPPMGPLEWVKKSPLADAAGWVDVDQATLQHKKYKNVWSLGDASSLPTSKTAAAITAQTPVLVHNLLTHHTTGSLSSSPAMYDGYTSCPLFTGRGSLLLAEFKYGLERKETFGKWIDQSKPNRLFYHLTKDVLPLAYFGSMLKGNWYGPKGVFPPQFMPS